MKIARISLLLLAAATSAAAALADTAAITPEQIEADWLHQDELRGKAASATKAPRVNLTPQQDAAGGVDGVINGAWGFHTQNEQTPWWQVDLGKATAIDRVVLYNRCDSCAGRNSRILVLLSDDGKTFRQAYQHDGTTFLGHTDKKPMLAKLDGKTARYLRLQLPGKDYFHLDEVQIYAPNEKANLALGKPATQSSTSQWSSGKTPAVVRKVTEPAAYATATVVERGLKLAESLRGLGADVDAEVRVLEQVRDAKPQAAGESERTLYFRARWAVRKMALKNPLLDFDTILFVKRAPSLFPHMSDQYYGWWSQGGGGVWLLSGFRGEKPQVRCITTDWHDGSFLRPDLSFDGKKLLFAYCRYYPHVAGIGNKVDKDALPEDAFYKIYEMNVDGSGIRQLTFGRYDDFDARYLPGGQIVFLSTRKGTSIRCSKHSANASAEAQTPDSYVRCGGGNSRPVAVFTLHRMDANGKNLCAISAFENFEWTPSVAADGRILYARWDYIDRFNGPFMSLWSTNPDGTNPQLVYGNFTKKPQCVFEARAIPNSQKLIFTACAHHSNNGGSLALLDRTRGSEFEQPLTRLTPEVPFPETEGWGNTYYATPLPLSEEHFLVAWSNRRLPPHSRVSPDDARNPRNAMGIYLYDAFGNLEPLYRDDKISSLSPIPLRPRKEPPRLPDTVDWDGPQEGRFLLQDIYQGMPQIDPGTITRLRVIAVPPKVQPQMNSPVLGVSREDPGKFILGTVPVEADGSAYFRVPSGVPVLFQAIDRDGLAVRTMRTLTYVQPNQTLACVGCHEARDATPLGGALPLALTREPSKLRPDPEGSWPLRYDQLVQPVLDRLCVRCHNPDGDDAKAAKFDLTPAKSYNALLSYAGNDLRNLARERDQSFVGDMPARKSRLLALLTEAEGHQKVRLDDESFQRLVTWMDTYAHRVGHFSDQQEEELREFRRSLAGMLDE